MMLSVPTSNPARNLVEPELVSLARRLVGEGTASSDGASQLVRHAGRDIETLAEAKSYWIRRLPTAKSRWDDHVPAKMLGMLEEAFVMVRPVPHSPDVVHPTAPRWWQRRKP